ncbi:type ISP restriction/modification enzyme [Arthrobacter sp. D2-10]
MAILIAVKNSADVGNCRIHYRDIGDYLTREQKLDAVQQATLADAEWELIEPNEAGDWTSQRDTAFATFTPLGDKKSKSEKTVFKTYSLGLSTSRDAWCYNYSEAIVEANVRRMIDVYNKQVDRIEAGDAQSDDVESDPRLINWSRGLRKDLSLRKRHSFNPTGKRIATYRPFSKQHVYFDRSLNETVLLMPSMFPTPYHQNYGFYVVGSGSAVPFSVFMLDEIPNLHVTGAGSGGQFLRGQESQRGDHLG